MCERFRAGAISIPRDEALIEELAALKYQHTSRGQIKMESKDEMKRRGMASPDRADMLAMLFEATPAASAEGEQHPALSRRESLRAEMAGW